MTGARFRASPTDGAAWVTGASAGLGRGVALELARRGFHVFATARREAALAALAAESAGLAGRIVAAPGDVTDRAGMAALYRDLEARGPVALALLNAGGAWRDAGDDFGGEGFQRTFAVNVQGLANCANPALAAMRGRGRGQIAVVGSLIGYGGVPNAYAYGPSKAAAISLAVGLKFLAERDGVRVQVINPGYVRTELTAGNRYPMPFLMDCDAASRRLCDGLARGGFEIRFPRRFALLVRLAQSLPYPLFFAAFRALGLR
ncbi:MAG: SDR family NAD(P)-dependent oxidoreductase [Pseudomonadota bacterium]|nr:SDR family NAD(P)-dependent oxidoreductase [Pseudomonadota bacterium]